MAQPVVATPFLVVIARAQPHRRRDRSDVGLPLGRTIDEFGVLMVAYTPRITVT